MHTTKAVTQKRMMRTKRFEISTGAHLRTLPIFHLPHPPLPLPIHLSCLPPNISAHKERHRFQDYRKTLISVRVRTLHALYCAEAGNRLEISKLEGALPHSPFLPYCIHLIKVARWNAQKLLAGGRKVVEIWRYCTFLYGWPYRTRAIHKRITVTIEWLISYMLRFPAEIVIFEMFT